MKRMYSNSRARLFVLVVVVVAMIVSGCGEKTPDYSAKPNREVGYVHSHPVGTTVRYDLNGDGVGENITVNTHEYEAGELTIGNSSVEIWSASPTGYFSVLNVDTSRDMLLVGISDYGPSDDFETVFYSYDGKRITEIGYINDIIGENAYDYTGATCHGDGTITARRRWDVLGTWNTVGLYEVDETGVVDITEFYPYLDWDGYQTGWEVVSKVPLIMCEEIGNTDTKTIVPTGTHLQMNGMRKANDAYSYWVSFTIQSTGKTFWMIAEPVDWVTYVPAQNDIITSEEAFDGFFYAG